jgi:hypothetical protein
MRRVLTIVEGFTERTVIEQTFAPYLGERGISLHAKIIGKPGHKGGIRSFESVCKEVLALLRQEPESYVSTFFDYYGLPQNWPGLLQAKGLRSREAAAKVELAMRREIAPKVDASDEPDRFIPYVQMHEIEALLFSDPKIMACAFERPDLETKFLQILGECGECEEIDDHPATAPSKRIETLFPAYRKGRGVRAHAPIIVRRIGVGQLRQACPHFNDWITRLEGIASGI